MYRHPFSPQPGGGGGEVLEFGGSPYPQRSAPGVVRAPRASMINCSNRHRVTEQHNHRPRHRMATRTATAAPLSEQRGFQDFHPCFGGPHNPVTGPGETSEASLPPFSYTVHGCHRLPGYRTLVQPMQDSHSGPNVALRPEPTTYDLSVADLMGVSAQYGTGRSCYHITTPSDR